MHVFLKRYSHESFGVLFLFHWIVMKYIIQQQCWGAGATRSRIFGRSQSRSCNAMQLRLRQLRLQQLQLQQRY
jgi:hypothetical protein